MPHLNSEDPNVKFKSAAKKIQRYLAEISRLNILIQNKEAALRQAELFTKDPAALPLNDELERLKLLRLAYEKAIGLVFSILEDIKRNSMEMYHAIYSVYICHRSVQDISCSIGVDSHHLHLQFRKEITGVMTKERMENLNLLEDIIYTLKSDSTDIKNDEEWTKIRTLEKGIRNHATPAFMS